MHHFLLAPGDPVLYTGQKHREDLTSKEGKPFKGWVHAAVNGRPGVFVVEFPETKAHDSYVMDIRVLKPWKPTKGEKHDGPEVQPRRKKVEED